MVKRCGCLDAMADREKCKTSVAKNLWGKEWRGVWTLVREWADHKKNLRDQEHGVAGGGR